LAETKEPSFGRLVVGKAISSTKRSFESVVRDVIVGVLSLAFGFFVYARLYGWPDAMKEVISAIAFGLAPFAFVLFVVFFWNLWLAPSELAYEASRQKVLLNAPSAQKKPVNWAPWRAMRVISLVQFSKVLANMDPANHAQSSESVAFYNLIWDSIKSGEISYIEELIEIGYGQAHIPRDLNEHSKIERNVAIRWAKEKGFPIPYFE
jgi:hypothetical protein